MKIVRCSKRRKSPLAGGRSVLRDENEFSKVFQHSGQGIQVVSELHNIAGIAIDHPSTNRSPEISHRKAKDQLFEVLSMIFALAIIGPGGWFDQGRKNFLDGVIIPMQRYCGGAEVKPFDGNFERRQAAEHDLAIQLTGFSVKGVEGGPKPEFMEKAALMPVSQKLQEDRIPRVFENHATMCDSSGRCSKELPRRTLQG